MSFVAIRFTFFHTNTGRYLQPAGDCFKLLSFSLNNIVVVIAAKFDVC